LPSLPVRCRVSLPEALQNHSSPSSFGVLRKVFFPAARFADFPRSVPPFLKKQLFFFLVFIVAPSMIRADRPRSFSQPTHLMNISFSSGRKRGCPFSPRFFFVSSFFRSGDFFFHGPPPNRPPPDFFPADCLHLSHPFSKFLTGPPRNYSPCLVLSFFSSHIVPCLQEENLWPRTVFVKLQRYGSLSISGLSPSLWIFLFSGGFVRFCLKTLKSFPPATGSLSRFSSFSSCCFFQKLWPLSEVFQNFALSPSQPVPWFTGLFFPPPFFFCTRDGQKDVPFLLPGLYFAPGSGFFFFSDCRYCYLFPDP